ncbi:ABC transporter substrate-binding protein [Kineococcus sp. SYSU DK002]|uniref:ABC transporter substrate-binding protein n=1 Tax=Kineococcus sp. SYSU DK002 TaxID=3383123 RepID=UPI003D7DD4FE
MRSRPQGRLPRRTFLSFAAGTSALGMAACSGGSVTGNTGDSEGRTTISVWHQSTAEAATKLDELIAQFNDAQADYTVSAQFIPGTEVEFIPRLVNAITNDQGPDLVLGNGNPSGLGQVIETGKVVALDDLLGTGKTPLDRAAIPQGMLDASTFDGTLYSLPTDGGDYAVFYNKALFAEAGITTPPTTWAELADVAGRLTTADRYGIYLPIGSGGYGEWTSFTWQSMLWSAGGEFLTADNSDVAFDTPAGVTALKTWTDIVAAGHAYPSSMADSNQNQGFPGFIAQEYAMFIGGAYNLGVVREGLGKENVGVFTFPRITQPAMNTGTNVSYILQTTDEKQSGAWAFLSWWLQPDVQAEWDIATGFLPTNQATTTSAAYADYLADDPDIKVFVDQLEYARTRPSISEYAEVSAALSTEIEKAMLLQQTPEQAIATAAANARAALAG